MQCDMMLEYKVAKFSPRVAKKVAFAVFLKSATFYKSPKCSQIFGLLL